MKTVMRLLGIFFMIGYVCSGAVAHAATYYVATNGSNSRSCAQAQSTSTPKLTLTNALTCLRAGDTLYVRGGYYNESLNANIYSNFPSGTSWDNKVRIAAYPGDSAVWLRPLSNLTGVEGNGRIVLFDANVSYVEFDGINLDGSNLLGAECMFWVSTNNGYNPHHIRLQNAEVIAGLLGSGAAVCLGAHTRIGATGSNEVIRVTIHGGGLPGLCGYLCNSYGIYVAGPNNIIDGCDIYDTSGAGVHIYNATGDAPDYNLVRNNRIHDITRSGRLDQAWGILNAGAHTRIYNNVIYGINVGNANQQNAAISLSGEYSEAYNNTLYGNAGWGILVGTEAAAPSGAIVRNNISYGNSVGNYANFNSSTYQSNNLFTDPRFNNAGGRDFSLRSDSAAIDKGAYIAEVQTDQVGISRPQGNGFDIGAYEFNWGSSPVVSDPAPSPSPPVSGSGASPDSTSVPGVSSVTDSSFNVWTIGPGQVILRNGSPAANGYGSQILWYQGVIYVLGTDSRWWKWTGSAWTVYGSASPSTQQVTATGSGGSADGTRVPAAASVTDGSLNVWTIGAWQSILRNGSATNGYGSQILWYQGVIYVLGNDSRWWRWTGSGWTPYGTSDPSGGASVSGGSSSASSSGGSGSSSTASASGTRGPNVSSLLDSALNVWTLGSSYEVLRNGSQVAGGYGYQILWYQNSIYVLGDDYNYWRFTGVTWVYYGPNAPG